MKRLAPLAALSLATLVGCSKAGDAPVAASGAPKNAESGAGDSASYNYQAPPGVQLAAYAPSSDPADEGRVFFDGDQLRDGLAGGGGAVRGRYSDNTARLNQLRRDLPASQLGRATYRQVPPPRGTTGNGLRPDASVPALPEGKVVTLTQYQAFEQAMYQTVYPVLSRAGWGARGRRGGATPMTPYRLTVHHTMGHQTHGEAETAAALRGIQAFHQGPERGWADIGYHFLIDGAGRVAEGRPANVLGAHAAEANNGNLGISLMGNFNVQHPSDAQMDSLERLAAYLALRYEIPVAKAGHLEGHNHHSETSCPGANLKSRLAEIRARVLQEEAKIRQTDAADGKLDYAAFRPMVVSRQG